MAVMLIDVFCSLKVINLKIENTFMSDFSYFLNIFAGENQLKLYNKWTQFIHQFQAGL